MTELLGVPSVPCRAVEQTAQVPMTCAADPVGGGTRHASRHGEIREACRTQNGTILRGYQSEAIAAIEAAWENGMQRPAALMATGLGKTVIFSELARDQAALGRRPVVLVHRDELVRQSVAKLRAADPELRIGVIQGRELGTARTDIVVASVQTLIRRLGVIVPSRFDLLIVDECHHATANSYRRIMEHFGTFDPNSGALALGVTATMSRGDGQGLGEIWDEVVFERDIRFGVEHGHLTPAEVRTVRLAGLNTDKIRAGADGDLAAGALAKAMSKAHAGPIVAKAYAEFAHDPATGRLRRGIVFASTIETAQAWAADFFAHGIRAAVVTGKTEVMERQRIYADLAAHRIDVIASVMVLTEGFDLPAVEVAVIGRPTKSMALLTQMVGRVLRPSPATGKTAALVVDVVGSMGSGLARTLDLSIPEPSEAIAPSETEVGERIGAAPDPALVVPEIDWVAIDLHGVALPAIKRRSDRRAPEWLRTYGGTPFLPNPKDFGAVIFIRAGEGGPFWIARGGEGVQPLQVAPGADVRDLHPGVPNWPAFLPATDAQAALLRTLTNPHTGRPLLGPEDPTPSKRDASDLLAVHFTSRALDRWRPSL